MLKCIGYGMIFTYSYFTKINFFSCKIISDQNHYALSTQMTMKKLILKQQGNLSVRCYFNVIKLKY